MENGKNPSSATVTPKPGTKKKSKYGEELDQEQEKAAKSQRDNQQLITYIFVVFIITSAWGLGNFGFSYLWIFMLIVLTFVVWWGKVMKLTEEHIKYQEILIHRKRALRQSETCEWLNFIINRWWVFSANTVSDLVKRRLDPVLGDVKPTFIDNIELESFSVGTETPYIKYVNVYEYTEGVPGGKKKVSWGQIASPPPGLNQVQQYQVVCEAEVGLQCDDFKMIFNTRLGGKWMGMGMRAAIEKLNINGTIQMVIHMDMDTPFPHVACVTVTFLQKPEVWFSVKVMRALQMMEIPLLKSWIHNLVMDGLTQALVDPGKIDLRMDSTGPTNIPAKAGSMRKAQGVLTITMGGEHLKESVFVDDIFYCVAKMGSQKLYTQYTQGHGVWQDTKSFLVENLSTDRLEIKSKSKVLLSTYTLAVFDVALADFPLQYKRRIETSLEEKASKKYGVGTVKLDLSLEYTPLPTIDSIVDKGLQQPFEPVSQVSGIMYVQVHSASNLLGLDRNGMSDPYCIIYSNGKKVKTTHYVARTKNPRWEMSTEFVIGDFTKTMLSFIVYDWDGRSTTEDDFLGSAHVLLTKDEPSVLRKSLTLGYNVLNIGQVDNTKLGNICVTVIFRPVPSVAKSELDSLMQATNIQSSHIPDSSHQPRSSKNFINTANPPTDNTTDMQRMSKKGATVGDVLAQGQGLLELNIKQARDLVAMDSNGFSDPYVEVHVNKERKFTTSIKKKTLDPVWDEWVTMQMPKTGETMEVIVWDRDMFFQKDFLGSVSFTSQDLKRLCNQPLHDGWYQLERIRSGAVQIHFNIISEDMEDDKSPTADFSGPRSDSGLGPEPPQLDSPQSATAPDIVTGTYTSENVGLTRPHKRSIKKSNEPKIEQAPPNGTAEQTTPVNPPKNVDKSATLPRRSTPVDNSPNYNSSAEESNFIRGGVRISNISNVSAATSIGSLAPEDKYYGLSGSINNIKGPNLASGPLYCKLRLDNRSAARREKKHSQGSVMAKSKTIDLSTTRSLDFSFNINPHGKGVAKEALLIVDLKTSSREHIVRKGFKILDLLKDQKECIAWLPLDNGIEVDFYLTHHDPSSSTLSRSSKGKGMFNFKDKHA